MESFSATLHKGKLCRMDTAKLNRDAVKIAALRYIHCCNLRRISSAKGGLPPMAYRERYPGAAL